MSKIRLIDINKSFKNTLALQNVNLEVRDGECTVFLGPSGAGKSTILNVIAGFELPDSGTVMIDDQNMNSTPTRERGLGMVFQNYALYPHKTVYENLAFPLKMSGIEMFESKTPTDPKKINKVALIERRIKEVANLLGIEQKLHQKPKSLSGGEQQRVAFGRAIIKNSTSAILMDEPFSNLDLLLRRKLRAELSVLIKKLNLTVLFVTHDQEEGISLADKLVVIRGGIIEQIGTPEEVYFKPKNVFVAEFIGKTKTNFLTAKIEEVDGEDHLKIGSSLTPLDKLGRLSLKPNSEEICLGIRSEVVELGDEGDQIEKNQLSLEFELSSIEFLGGHYLLKGYVSKSYFEFTCKHMPKISKNNAMMVFVKFEDILLFDNVSNLNLRQ